MRKDPWKDRERKEMVTRAKESLGEEKKSLLLIILNERIRELTHELMFEEEGGERDVFWENRFVSQHKASNSLSKSALIQKSSNLCINPLLPCSFDIAWNQEGLSIKREISVCRYSMKKTLGIFESKPNSQACSSGTLDLTKHWNLFWIWKSKFRVGKRIIQKIIWGSLSSPFSKLYHRLGMI